MKRLADENGVPTVAGLNAMHAAIDEARAKRAASHPLVAHAMATFGVELVEVRPADDDRPAMNPPPLVDVLEQAGSDEGWGGLCAVCRQPRALHATAGDCTD